MKLTHIALLAVRGSREQIVPKLALALGVHERTVYRYIKDNTDDLTKAAALRVIREETGLADDQIVEDSPVAA
jgi:hypothetical protein